MVALPPHPIDRQRAIEAPAQRRQRGARQRPAVALDILHHRFERNDWQCKQPHGFLEVGLA